MDTLIGSETANSRDQNLTFLSTRDVLHPNRANVSKDELREKLADLYKSNKDQVSVFGFRTQYGGGKSTGFALVYDSNEAMKKFEPHFRLVRVGAAEKVEKASRQQRTSLLTPCPGEEDANPVQASKERTAPRSSAVSPRPRAPRRARTKCVDGGFALGVWLDPGGWVFAVVCWRLLLLLRLGYGHGHDHDRDGRFMSEWYGMDGVLLSA